MKIKIGIICFAIAEIRLNSRGTRRGLCKLIFLLPVSQGFDFPLSAERHHQDIAYNSRNIEQKKAEILPHSTRLCCQETCSQAVFLRYQKITHKIIVHICFLFYSFEENETGDDINPRRMHTFCAKKWHVASKKNYCFASNLY